MKVTASPSFFKSLEKLDSFKSKLLHIKAWFRYHFNKDFMFLQKTLLKSYPWDYSFLYELEKAKITEIANYIEKNKRYIGWEQDVRDMFFEKFNRANTTQCLNGC